MVITTKQIANLNNTFHQLEVEGMYKRLVSIILSFTLLLCLSSTASAAEVKTVYDLAEYMSLTDLGTISFDSDMALQNGFPTEMVSRHSQRISAMNQLVLDGIATIDETYTARIYLTKTRGADQSYVDSSVWGVTRIYLNAQDTKTLLNYMNNTGKVLTVSSLISLIKKEFTGFIGDLTALMGVATLVYQSQVETAAKNGTGIIIAIHDDGTTATPFVVVTPR